MITVQGSGKGAGSSDSEDHCAVNSGNAMSTRVARSSAATLSRNNSDLLTRCLCALDIADAACKQGGALEVELQTLVHKITAMTIKLAGVTADVSRARYQSFHDGLTSLPNGQLFLSTLTKLLSDQSCENVPLAVIYLDLDDFKSVNDLYGHQFGDHLLNIVGARLLACLRPEDMVCRMGGDEFACLLINVASTQHLCAIATKLHATISAAAMIGDVQITISPSIGIAVYPGNGITAHDLVKNADTAMYTAKRKRIRYALSETP